MEDRPIRFGALSLLLLVVMVCLAVLGVLSYSTARASDVMAQRQAVAAREVYRLESAGQKWLAGLDGVLVQAQASDDPRAYLVEHIPNGATIEGDLVSMLLVGEQKRTLLVEVLIDESYEFEVVTWRSAINWSPDASMGNLWNGE